MTPNELIAHARQQQCSDIHLSEGLPVQFRINGQLVAAPFESSAAETRALILDMMDDAQRCALEAGIDQDFAYETPNGERQRVNVYRYRMGLSAAIRLLNAHIPTLGELNLPPAVTHMLGNPRGLILVTGPTGSGKSTTLAAMIDHLSKTRQAHILTVEDPVEYVFPQQRSLIHQREVGADVPNFAAALRSALREDPDIILVGEMRDYETISIAVTAAETGHLVLSTLHTTSAAETIDRIVDTCPTQGQQQMRTQLSTVLRGIITQQLVPLASGEGRMAATEILVNTDAVGNLIRENKGYQVASIMQSSGQSAGMHMLSSNLASLTKRGLITLQTAYRYANSDADLRQYLD